MIYSKFNDINAVLTKAYKLLEAIEVQYNQSLHDKKINIDLLVEIKDYLWNLKSWLDYLWNKIWLDYFPFWNSEKDFLNKVKEINQNLVDNLKEIQPYNDNIIKNFNVLNNKNKHLTLIPQKRQETRQITVSNWWWSVSWGPWVTFWNWVSIMWVSIDPKTQLPIPNNAVKTEIITWIDFIFDNSNIDSLDFNISALPFLKLSFQKVLLIITKIEELVN